MKKMGILNFLLFLCCFPALYAQGTVTVNSNADDGSAGTFRWAINTANTDPLINEIVFDTGFTGTLLLTANLPTITADLTISGPGVDNFTISGENQFTMFVPSNGVTLNISRMSFTKNASAWGSGTVLYATRATINADNIKLEGNSNAFAIYSKEGGSVINVTNSTFSGNGGYLFGSDHGSTPNSTSEVESDYTNRITVTGSTFSANTGVIFYTERYVKLDNCIFEDNSGQIGIFRGVNRYQVLNSTFTGNTGNPLFSFYSWIGETPSWGEGTLGTNNTLFEGNTFIGNTGTVIYPGNSTAYYNKTTISNNIFGNNGTNWTGSPIVVSDNTLGNFFAGLSHDAPNATVTVSMARAVFGANDGTGNLGTGDFIFSLNGGNATLGSSTPTSISVTANDYTLGLDVTGIIHGNEILTITLANDAVYDASGNLAAPLQNNNTLVLDFLDGDLDGVPDYLDECPATPLGDVVEPNGCTDVTSPDVPTGLTIKARAYGLHLEWDESLSDTVGYHLYSGEDESAMVLLSTITSSGTTTYLHSGLSVDKTYFYYLTAYDLAGNESSASPVISETPVLPFIWDGPSLVFEKLVGTDWTLVENQDYLTDNVIITRGNYQGLFNIAEETFFNSSSPNGTEWAMGATTNFGTLVFSTWYQTMNGRPPDHVGNNFVVHLIEDDIYIDVKILSWSSGSGGGFSYERSTPSPDGDNDRVKDDLDQCPATPTGESVDANGCSDSQRDDDGDGLNNGLDQCPATPSGEVVDANGCSASQKDADSDGVNDALDICAATPSGETVDANGCSGSQKDADGDGINDATDQCPATPTGETVDANGCSDSQKDTDSDGINDAADQCPATPTGETVDANGCSDSQKDADSDGINDAADQCTNTSFGETVDANGCSGSQKDADSDGVNNAADQCAATPTGETVDANGCSASQKDADSDGVNDALDQCSATPSGETVDANGCSASQKDADSDGVNNAADQCTDTPFGETVDANGCSTSQKDADSDGVNDAADQCPATPTGETVDANGCSASQKDADSDGVNDAADQCPATPTGETVDANGCSASQKDVDSDGINDVEDQCADTPFGEVVDANGCSDSQKDADGDGVSDTMDNCPMNHNPGQEDRDGDGFGDLCDTVVLDISQAFTPNGDGINDTWTIHNIENHPNSLVRVFNSWGKEVFSAKNYMNDWDGHYKSLGNQLPDSGSYYFQIDLEGDGKVDQDGWLYITSN